jgi:hypothetical protein
MQSGEGTSSISTPSISNRAAASRDASRNPSTAVWKPTLRRRFAAKQETRSKRNSMPAALHWISGPNFWRSFPAMRCTSVTAVNSLEATRLRICSTVLRHVYYADRHRRQPQPAGQPCTGQLVHQKPSVLRIILELHHVIVAVRAAHQVRLRAAAHPAYLLDGP